MLDPQPVIKDRRLRDALDRADGEIANRLIEMAVQLSEMDHTQVHTFVRELCLCYQDQIGDRPLADLWSVAWRRANGTVFFMLFGGPR